LEHCYYVIDGNIYIQNKDAVFYIKGAKDKQIYFGSGHSELRKWCDAAVHVYFLIGIGAKTQNFPKKRRNIMKILNLHHFLS